MKAKTAKFLAVLAILAMAFAAVAVFAPVESDAVEVQSVWTTPAKAEAPAQSDPWSLKLGTDAIIPTDGQTIDGNKVYYVNSDMSLVMADDADLSVGGTLIMLKSGVHVSVQVPQKHEKTIAYAIAGVDESKDKDGNTILTFYGNYSGSAFQAWVGTTDNKGFHFPTKWTGDAGADNTNTIIGNQTIGMSKAQGGGNFEFESGVTVDGNEKKCVYMAYTDTDCAWYLDFGFFAFNFQYIYQYDAPGANGSAWNMMDAYGAVGSYGEDNKLDLNGFTGVLTMKADGTLEITKWIAGDITVTKGSVVVGADATIPAGSSITFANGVIVSDWTVSYKRFVVDVYKFTMDGDVKAGAAGLTITAGMNGLELSGAATVMKDDSKWTFEGAAEISGILNMDNKKFTIAGEGYQITLRDFRADNAVNGLTLIADTVFESQVTVSGTVNAEGSMIVAPFAFVNITGLYNFVEEFGTFVGKDATLRVSTASGDNGDYTASDERWAEVAFVDVTGKFFLNQNLVTTTSGAVITYLYQVGEGQVSVNSSICATYSEYYLYKQVIPYLLLNPVDVVCTSLIAEQADITLKGVDYTGGELPIGNQARYTIDYTTGVPELTVIFKELYPVEIKNAYANGVEKIEVIDDENNKVFMEPKTGESTTGIVKLAYTYDYIVKGVNENNKYTFYFDGDKETGAKLDPITVYSSEFTMVRGYMTYATAAQESNVPHFITYEEGLAVELTVILDEEDYTQYSEGDVFMYFTTEVDEKGKPTGEGTPVVLSTIKVDNKSYLGAIITKGLYSTDTVFFKSEHRLFYKLIAVKADSTNVVFPSSSQSAELSVDFSSTKWSSGFGFTSATITKATLGVDCGLDEVEITFVLPDGMPTNKKVYVDFSVYCSDANHKASVKVDAAGSTPIKMCVGEEYEITWDPIDGKIMDMTFVKTDVAGDEDKPYTEGTTVVASPVALTYKLTVTPIYYMTVINNTDYDLTVSIGEFRADIGADDKNEKVIVNDGVGNAVVLSKKGYTVNNWTFDLKTSPLTHEYVSGTMTTKALITKEATATTPEIPGYYSAFPTTADIQATFVMTITNAQVTPITYTVDVEADDHATITYFDNSGQLGQLRKAYVQPWQEYDVIAVEYEYQEIDMAQKAVGQAEKKTSPETGQEYWEYVMPASNVLLKPIVQKETRNLSFVDETGATIAETQKVEPRTTVNEPVPCKPLCVITDVTTEPVVEGFVYNPETGYMTFNMPDMDVKVIVTCKEIDYSTDVIVTVGQKGMPITLVITALDGKQIASGTIKMNVTYTYTDEDGEISTDVVTVTKNYVAGESTVITDQEFITLLGDNYSGAFAVTGTFEFGYAVGSLSKTVYTPVLGA